MLDDGHVPADLAEAAQRDDADAAVDERLGQVEVGVRVAHRVGSVARADRSTSRCSGGDSTSGSRTAADSMTPSSTRAALGRDRALGGRHQRIDDGDQRSVDAAGLGEVAPVDGGDHRGILLARHVADDGHDAVPHPARGAGG